VVSDLPLASRHVKPHFAFASAHDRQLFHDTTRLSSAAPGGRGTSKEALLRGLRLWANPAHDSVYHGKDLVLQPRAIHEASANAQSLQVRKDLSAASVFQRFSDKLAQTHLEIVWRHPSTGLQ